MNVFCTENNYSRDIAGGESGDGPVIYKIPSDVCISSADQWNYQKWENHQLFVQTELVIRIAKDLHDEPITDLFDFVEEVTTGLRFIQINLEDVRNKNKVPWEKMHVWPGSFLTGEWLSKSFLSYPNDVNFCLYKNREMAQLGNTESMIAGLPALITQLGKAFPVKKGDILYTGTPPGVCELMPGDELEFFLEDETAGEIAIG